ncbi:MAG: hypothetical protein MZV64_12580 [Ignavibacteriales bacterium]|nr:hypothetical protein [Ignavibacteriales bacterium]
MPGRIGADDDAGDGALSGAGGGQDEGEEHWGKERPTGRSSSHHVLLRPGVPHSITAPAAFQRVSAAGLTGREVPRYHPGHDDRPRALERGLRPAEAGPRAGHGVRLLGQDDRRLARSGPAAGMPEQPGRRAAPRSRRSGDHPRGPRPKGALPRVRRADPGGPGRPARRPDAGGRADRDARLRLVHAQVPQVRRRDPGRLGEAAGRAARSGRAGPDRRREGGHRRGPRRRHAHPLPLRLPLRLAPGLDGAREPVRRPDDRPGLGRGDDGARHPDGPGAHRAPYPGRRRGRRGLVVGGHVLQSRAADVPPALRRAHGAPLQEDHGRTQGQRDLRQRPRLRRPHLRPRPGLAQGRHQLYVPDRGLAHGPPQAPGRIRRTGALARRGRQDGPHLRQRGHRPGAREAPPARRARRLPAVRRSPRPAGRHLRELPLLPREEEGHPLTELGRNGPGRRHEFVRGPGDEPAAVAPDEEPAVDPLLRRHREARDLGLVKDQDVGHIAEFPDLHPDDLLGEAAVLGDDRGLAPLEGPLVEVDEVLDEPVQVESRQGDPARPQDDHGLLDELGADPIPVRKPASGRADEAVEAGDDIADGLRGRVRGLLSEAGKGGQAHKQQARRDRFQAIGFHGSSSLYQARRTPAFDLGKPGPRRWPPFPAAS